MHWVMFLRAVQQPNQGKIKAMWFSNLQSARFVQRYKRFLVDLKNADGEIFTVHCPNTGAMTGCTEENALAYYSLSDNPRRKYPGTLEWLELNNGHRVCINTQRPNALVAEAIQQGVIRELQGYRHIQSEQLFGAEGSRVDFKLSAHEQGLPDCFVEVKNATLLQHGHGYFPDAVSIRALKHLRELMLERQQGARAMLLYCVNHTGIEMLSPARHIHPDYAQCVMEAAKAGVEMLAYRTSISPEEIRITDAVPLTLQS